MAWNGLYENKQTGTALFEAVGISDGPCFPTSFDVDKCSDTQLGRIYRRLRPAMQVPAAFYTYEIKDWFGIWGKQIDHWLNKLENKDEKHVIIALAGQNEAKA